MTTHFTFPLNGQSPFSLFCQLTHGPGRILLESADERPGVGEYSYICWDPIAVFDSRKVRGNPFDQLKKFYMKHRSKSGKGMMVGFIGYEAGRFLERLPNGKHDPELEGIPDLYFIVPGQVVVVDHRKALQIADCRLQIGKQKSQISNLKSQIRVSRLHPSMSRRAFERMVLRAKEYIAAGDIYQANLSQRFSFGYEGEPIELYARLRAINPSPFSAFLDFGDLQIVSSSPERLIRLRDGRCETRPIAGTRPRGGNFREDGRLSRELLLNEKEKAEHLMLVDLERNDLGRVSDFRTVRVDEFMTLEKYSHVIHIVSNVTGRLSEGRDAFDVIRAMFPGGTITGCPKIRSMEIIHELEPVRRGVYTGSIGYIGFDGSMDFNIVIRSILCRRGRGFIQVGAGIVHDSIPGREYEETLHKAQAMFEALRDTPAEGFRLTKPVS